MSNPAAITFRFRLGDTEHVVRSGHITGRVSGILRAELGVGFARMLDAIVAGDLDADYLAALVWLARVQNGERHLELRRMLDAVTFDDIARFDVVTDDAIEPGTAPDDDVEGGDSPES